MMSYKIVGQFYLILPANIDTMYDAQLFKNLYIAINTYAVNFSASFSEYLTDRLWFRIQQQLKSSLTCMRQTVTVGAEYLLEILYIISGHVTIIRLIATKLQQQTLSYMLFVMTEVFTQMRVEDAVANTSDFLLTERGVGIDGEFAGRQVAERVATVQERARAVLQSVPHPKLDGLYVPLSKYNATGFDEAAAVLPGYIVLVPSALVESGTNAFYPAVVSEDGLKYRDTIRLHVLKQTYRQRIGYGTSTILSAAGQSETNGIGEHGRKMNDGVEAEHFDTLLTVGSDAKVQAEWVSGKHVNHEWREQPGSSVTTEVAKRLFGSDVPQDTITITKRQIEEGKAMLLWHDGMTDQTGNPETAAKDNALVVIQSLGFEALKAQNPKGVDTIKRLIA